MLDLNCNVLASAGTTVPVIAFPKRLDPFGERYTQVKRIGGGCCSDVYQCFDNETSREIVLKALNRITGRRHDDRERFLREPIIMSTIDHPSVPMVYGRYRELEPAPYFTMEYIRGTNLAVILSGLRKQDDEISQRFSLSRLISLIADACEGFTAAHERDILHRDIKPENLMIDDHNQVRIIDWGVSKVISDNESKHTGEQLSPYNDRRRSTRLTQAGRQPGTLIYMSPEQAIGLTQLDARSDIYSLGAVLFDCLALTTFIGGVSDEEVVRRIYMGPQVRPSQVALRDSIPKELEDVCMKALEIDPRKRFETMRQFRDALLACKN